MPYCSKCGYEVLDGETFCEACGTPIRKNSKNTSKRETVFEGKIHKCPRCGEIVDAFQSRCPTCLHELRDTSSSDSINKLAADLQMTFNEGKKIQIVRTSPVPNSKEDIFEFMFMAESNFDEKKYAENRDKESLDAAWLAKIEQCYNKARMTLKNQSDLEPIEELYNRAKQKAAKAESDRQFRAVLPYICLIGGSALCLVQFRPIQSAGAIILVVGIVLLCMNKSKSKPANTNTNPNTYYRPMNSELYPGQYAPYQSGFSSWSNGKKIGWVILNIYTFGIPALISSRNKKR